MQSNAGHTKVSLPATPTQTKYCTNHNWSPRYHDGKHKPKEKK